MRTTRGWAGTKGSLRRVRVLWTTRGMALGAAHTTAAARAAPPAGEGRSPVSTGREGGLELLEGLAAVDGEALEVRERVAAADEAEVQRAGVAVHGDVQAV